MTNLEVLAKKHVHEDILIVAERLYPERGWLVEYEHWSMHQKPVMAIAWIEMLSDGERAMCDRIELFQTRP